MTTPTYPTRVNPARRRERPRCRHWDGPFWRPWNIEEVTECPTFEATRSDDGISLYFTCPCCRVVNSHGAVGPRHGEGNGHRGQHCPCWARGYVIVETGPDFEARDRPGFERRRAKTGVVSVSALERLAAMAPAKRGAPQ